MNNYEKLCEVVGINPIFIPKKVIKDGLQLKEMTNTFTAEKQLEFIKLIIDTTIQTIEIDKPGNYYNVQTMEYDITLETEFSEALAGLVLQLIKAGELNKDEVKRILE